MAGRTSPACPARASAPGSRTSSANPAFTFHLKGNAGTPVADLPATARVITDEAERREVFGKIIESAWHQQDLETMVRESPLIEVTFDELAA